MVPTYTTSREIFGGMHLVSFLNNKIELVLPEMSTFSIPTQIQRNLQMRIEEQGRQLKMMIDQQQKANENLIKKQDLDITSFDDQPSFSLEEVEASIAESSGNAQFPTKIS